MKRFMIVFLLVAASMTSAFAAEEQTVQLDNAQADELVLSQDEAPGLVTLQDSLVVDSLVNRRLVRRVECFARNRRGFTFAGVARSARVAQDLAVAKCRRTSQLCVATGCRETFVRR